MRRSCLHTHTIFCDGADTVEELCREAYERKFYSLGFSAHAPIPSSFCPPTGWNIPEDRLDEYAETVRDAKERWKGKLDVYLGLEIDFIQGVCGPGDGRFGRLGLDYTIGSVHYLVPPNGAAPFTVDGPRDETIQGIRQGFGGDAAKAMRAYWDAVRALIEAGSFDILGHMDLIKKNIHGSPWYDPETDSYRKGYAEAAEALAKTGIVVEVNTGGLNRGTVPEVYPSPEILRLLRKLGVRTTINADAHRKQHLEGYYEEARNILMDAGYRTICLFSGEWEEEAL